MDDPDEAAAIVNALQRHATVVVQKSLAEGFGLTVAEAMWKSRPVVGSAVGGIVDQIVSGETGLLLDDPHDLERYGAAVCSLLGHRERDRMGTKAIERAAAFPRRPAPRGMGTAVRRPRRAILIPAHAFGGGRLALRVGT